MSRGVEHGGFCRTRRVRRRVPGAQAFAMDSRRFGGRKMSLFPAWAWVGFTGLIVFLLVLDLMVLGRGAREISFRQATALSIFWIGLALLFGVAVLFMAGSARGGGGFPWPPLPQKQSGG